MSVRYRKFAPMLDVVRQIAKQSTYLIGQLRVKRLGASSGDSLFTAGATASVMVQTATPITISITFPASGLVALDTVATFSPTANNSTFYLSWSADGGTTIGNEVVALYSPEPKGRRVVSCVLTNVPYSTKTYTLCGRYSGGSGGRLVISTASGDLLLFTIMPL
jgi:hypothetical protein